MSSSTPIAGHMKALLHHIKSVRNEVQKLDKPSAEDLIHYQQHLRTIEHHKHDGVWCGKLSTHLVPNGQAEVQAAFQEAHDLIEKKLQQSETEVVDPAADEELSLISAITLQVNEVLSELKRLQYEGNVNTAAILPFQHYLNAIEKHRHNGVWGGKLSGPACQGELNKVFEEASQLANKLAHDDDQQ